MTNYAIDSSVLIDAAKYYPIHKASFRFFWDKIGDMFNNNRIISSVEIYEELKNDLILKDWLLNYQGAFLEIDDAIQQEVAKILGTFPGLVKLKRRSKSNSNADPFLIATAIVHKCTILTSEKKGDMANGQVKIPNVCEGYNIPCYNLEYFLDVEFD
ncbi:MAG: DUF4411 family protein [Armatimonadota bacterium]